MSAGRSPDAFLDPGDTALVPDPEYAPGEGGEGYLRIALTLRTGAYEEAARRIARRL